MSKKKSPTLKSRIQAAKNLIKQRTKDLTQQITSFLYSLYAPTMRVLLLTATMLLAGTAITMAPQLHRSYLRSEVGSKVYVVRGSYDGRGGGTGFAVKAPSGKSYIVTNDHVCEASKDKKTMFVHDDSGVGIPRQILERSVYSDLCILEGMPGVEGLSVSYAPSPGDELYVVGHPKLMPLTLSHGEMIGKETVSIPIGMVSEELKCDQPKNVMLPLITIIFGVTPDPGYSGPMVCLERIKDAYLTNVIIQPGNSGSPVVDALGNVVAVVFAGDGLGWGVMVSNIDLRVFLALY
jgi:S1-C subfamily serine protease